MYSIPYQNQSNIIHPQDIISNSGSGTNSNIHSNNNKQPVNKTISYITIDSRDRNTHTYNNISNYRIQLSDSYKKTCKIELSFAFIPNSLYNINNNNNQLHFTEQLQYTNDNILSINIPVGNYDKTPITNSNPKQDLLAQHIQTMLNNKGNATYSVEYDSLLDNYIIESDLYDKNMNVPTIFQLLFEGEKKPYGKYSIEKVPVRNSDDTIKRDSNGAIVYQETFFGEKVSTYIDKTIGKHLGFDKTTYNGLINGSINNDPNNNTYIIGTNTFFTQDLIVDKYIIIANTINNQPTQLSRYKIKTIISDTELELDSIISNIDNAQLYTGRFQGCFTRNISTDKYVMLNILNNNLNRLNSTNKHIQDAFAIIPIINQFKQPWPDEKKFDISFTNTLPDIEYLDIQFTDYYGNLIDFNGHDHLLIFAITTMNNNNLD